MKKAFLTWVGVFCLGFAALGIDEEQAGKMLATKPELAAKLLIKQLIAAGAEVEEKLEDFSYRGRDGSTKEIKGCKSTVTVRLDGEELSQTTDLCRTKALRAQTAEYSDALSWLHVLSILGDLDKVSKETGQIIARGGVVFD